MTVKSTFKKLQLVWVIVFLVVSSFSRGWASFDVHVVDDPGHYFGELEPEHAIAVGSDGAVFIAYGGDNLYLATTTNQGVIWQIETVDANGIVGKYPSLALDHNNYPHISYYDGTFGKLKYARWNGVSWQIETVDTVGIIRPHTAIAIDSNDRPHISYHDSNNDSLKYAHFNGITWNIETLDTSNPFGVGQWCSIAVDSGNNPHIGYYDWANNDLKYLAWTGSNWLIETVDTAAAGQYTSIALDQSGNVHLSYYDSSGRDLQYAFRDNEAASWSLDTVDATGRVGWHTSISADPTGQCHISYYDWDNGTIKYANGTLANWSIATVETVGANISFDLFTSIAVDSSGVPHIAYGKQNGPRILDLKYARWSGTAWSMTTVNSSRGAIETGDPGTALAIDNAGNRHIGYIDRGNYYGNSALKYVFHNGMIWDKEIVDGGQTPTATYDFHSPAIAIQSNNYPHMAYAFSENLSVNALKYASWNGSAWQIEVVTYQSVADISLALDSTNRPHISFRERGNDNLLYAHWTGSVWNIEVVEYTGHVGAGSAIAIDSADRPHISYLLNGSNLNYAHLDSSWQIEFVGMAHLGSTSIALDNSDRPHISYQYNEDLMYAHFNGSTWDIETVDSANRLGWDNAIALDSSGNAHICYYDISNNDLKYTYRDGSQWEIYTVDGPGTVGRFGSIALDASNRPHMSYVDMGNLALKYAVLSGPFPWILFMPAIYGGSTP